jgi:hypothetical protein
MLLHGRTQAPASMGTNVRTLFCMIQSSLFSDSTPLPSPSEEQPTTAAELLRGSRCTVLTPGYGNFRGERALAAHYCIVAAEDLPVSHDVSRISARSRSRVQNRRLEAAAAREQVNLIYTQALLGRLSPLHVLDRSSFMVLGPPTLDQTREHVVAGNHRAYLLMFTAKNRGSDPVNRAREAYMKELTEVAPSFGICPGQLAALHCAMPALVRILDEHMSEEELNRINRMSDREISKPYDPVSRASILGDRFLHAPAAMNILFSFIRSECTDRQDSLDRFFASPHGARFITALVSENVISDTEAIQFRDRRPGVDTPGPSGREWLTHMIAAAALGNGAVIDNLPDRYFRKLVHCFPRLLQYRSRADWADMQKATEAAVRLLGSSNLERIPGERGRIPRAMHDALVARYDGTDHTDELPLRIAQAIMCDDVSELRDRFEQAAAQLRIATQPAQGTLLESAMEYPPTPVSFADIFPLRRHTSAKWPSAEAKKRYREDLVRFGRSTDPTRDIRQLLPDRTWHLAAPILRELGEDVSYDKPKKGKGVDLRAVLAVVTHIRRSGIPWRRLLSYYGYQEDDEAIAGRSGLGGGTGGYPRKWGHGRANTVRKKLAKWRRPENKDLFGCLCKVLDIPS